MDRLWSFWKHHMYFTRLMRDLTLPTDWVLLSQIIKNAQMFCNLLSLQLLCNVACEQKCNASAEIWHPRQRASAGAGFGPAAFAGSSLRPCSTPRRNRNWYSSTCVPSESIEQSVLVGQASSGPTCFLGLLHVCAFHL